GGERAPGVAERELPVPGDVQQPVPLHPGHGLADGRPALREPLGDARPQRDDALLLEFEYGAEIHLRRVYESLGCQLLILLLVMLCAGAKGKCAPRPSRCRGAGSAAGHAGGTCLPARIPPFPAPVHSRPRSRASGSPPTAGGRRGSPPAAASAARARPRGRRVPRATRGPATACWPRP